MIRLLAAFTFTLCVAAQAVQVGAVVPEFRIAGAREITSRDLRGRIAVVTFISAECPISNAYNERMSALFKAYDPSKVTFLFVNSNVNESAAEIADHARQAGFPFAVLRDPDSRLAGHFGAMATPETFVIDAAGVLRYHGYIDDSQNPARVHNTGLKNAIDALLAGRPVDQPETKAFGCTIKRPRRAS